MTEAFAKSPPTEMPPPGACDCHAHVFGAPDDYPLAPGADYTPDPAPVEKYAERLDSLGLDRGVLVQPSVYGTDNRCLIDALGALGKRARGVAVIDRDTEQEALAAMHAAGVRAVRLNTLAGNAADVDIDAFDALAQKVAPLGWHVQLLIASERITDWQARIAAAPCPVVLDHFALLPPGTDANDTALRAVVDLLSGGNTWIKLSAPYLKGIQRADAFSDHTALAERLWKANPDRLLWGSDWPHPALPHPHPAESEFLRALNDWRPNLDDRRHILVNNPARLFGFSEA